MMRRRDRLIREKSHDPYRAQRKLREPTVCPECAAVFREGRWRWASGPADAARSLCPACQRVRDSYPAGTLTIEGDYAAERRAEILALVRNVEAREKADHPLQRIMATQEEGAALVVTTTDIHLARSIGNALHAAHSGELEIDQPPDESLLRISWRR
jgi:NMD protein affecting ribosome stability and mRNA decay